MDIDLDLWLWRLDAPDPAHLSPDEAARAARFVFARDRDRFIAGRARLRQILARYLGLGARQVAFRYGPHGRPEVETSDTPEAGGITFNLSHSGDLAALVVTRAPLPLGADIETLRPIEPTLAQACFAPPEIAALNSLPPAGYEAAFHRCWTRKEAFLKAMGTGLSTDLSSFCVTLGPDQPPRLLSCAGDDAAEWTLLDFTPAPGVAGAIAIRNGRRPIRLHRRTWA